MRNVLFYDKETTTTNSTEVHEKKRNNKLDFLLKEIVLLEIMN